MGVIKGLVGIFWLSSSQVFLAKQILQGEELVGLACLLIGDGCTRGDNLCPFLFEVVITEPTVVLTTTINHELDLLLGDSAYCFINLLRTLIATAGIDKDDALFGVEFNLTMPFLNSDRYRYFSNGRILGTLNTSGSQKSSDSFGILDSGKEMEVKLEFSKKPKEIWYFPIETISQSQIAYRLNYQCSSIFPLWKLSFDKENTCRIKIDWSVGKRCR